MAAARTAFSGGARVELSTQQSMGLNTGAGIQKLNRSPPEGNLFHMFLDPVPPVPLKVAP